MANFRLEDQERLKVEYARRRKSASTSRYSFFHSADRHMIIERQHALARLLSFYNLTDLSQSRLLEIGCGRGDVLTEYLNYRLLPNQLIGIDLLMDRVQECHRRYPQLSIIHADGMYLPFKSSSFDLVLQYLVFSSILDKDIKRQIAREMLRVIRPDGLILWYDFWINPTNPQTQGIRLREIHQLFPNCKYVVRKITLAPPLTLHLVPISRIFCLLLEKLIFLNTHYLVAISPNRQ